MKAAVSFRPGWWTRTGDYITLTCTVAYPANMPRELPAVAPTHRDTWTVIIGIRQWQKVASVLRDHRDDQLIIEGAPVCLDGKLMLFAQSVKSVFIEQQRRDAQRAASLAATAS